MLNIQKHTLIYGPINSGKTQLLKQYIKKTIADDNGIYLNAIDDEFITLLRNFLRIPLQKNIAKKIIAIDDIEYKNIKLQYILKYIIETYDDIILYIATTNLHNIIPSLINKCQIITLTQKTISTGANKTLYDEIYETINKLIKSNDAKKYEKIAELADLELKIKEINDVTYNKLYKTYIQTLLNNYI